MRMVSLVSTPVSAPAARPLPERSWLLTQAGAAKPATALTRTVSERALQDMIDGKLTPQQADRLIRAAVTTDGVLVKLLGALKWGAIASLPFLLTGDSNPRVAQSQKLTDLLHRGDLHGFFGFVKALAGHDGAKAKGIEAIATLTANLLAAGKPHSASRVLQQVIGALNKEGLVNLGNGNSTDLALEAVMAAYRRQHQAQPLLGPPTPKVAQAQAQPKTQAAAVTVEHVLNHFTARVPGNQQATYNDVLIQMMKARGIDIASPHEVAKWVTKLFHSEKLKLVLQRHVDAALAAKAPLPAPSRQQLIDQVASSPAAAGTRNGPKFEVWRDAIKNKLDHSGVSNSMQTVRFFNRLAPQGVIAADSQIWRAIRAEAHKRLDQRMATSQTPAGFTAPRRGSTPDFSRLKDTGIKVEKTVPAANTRSPEEIEADWRILGDSSEAGGQLVREAAREGWSENEVLDYIRSHPDQNLNQVLAALRDGALGVGGGAPPGGIRSGVTASAGAPDGKAVSGAPSPPRKPSAEAVLKRQAEIYKKIRDNDLTGEYITVQVEGKTVDAAALDRELVSSSGKATGFTARDMIKIAGSLKGATINIKLHSRAISIIQRHPQLEGSNKLTVYPDLKTVYFINLKVNQTSSKPGFGTALRLQQLVASEKLGMRGATLTAARSKDYPTGYFTWPKFGFDAELPNAVKPALTEYLLANPDVAKKLGLKPDALPTHLMLSELLFNADGSDHLALQAWWKAKGTGTEMGINFSGPSGARFHKMAGDLGWLLKP
jgi:hypothetical protein